MRETLSITEVRERFAETVGRVQRTGERIVIQKHGKPVAALVAPSDLAALEALEDRLDLLDALDALADYRTNGGTGLEALKAALGISPITPWRKLYPELTAFGLLLAGQ